MAKRNFIEFQTQAEVVKAYEGFNDMVVVGIKDTISQKGNKQVVLEFALKDTPNSKVYKKFIVKPDAREVLEAYFEKPFDEIVGTPCVVEMAYKSELFNGHKVLEVKNFQI